MDIRDFVEVRVEFHNVSGCERHIVLKADWPKFVEATEQLHYKNPGYNPHSKGETARLAYISVNGVTEIKSSWHTTPGLQDTGDGARTVWFHWPIHSKSYELTTPDCPNGPATLSLHTPGASIVIEGLSVTPKLVLDSVNYLNRRLEQHE